VRPGKSRASTESWRFDRASKRACDAFRNAVQAREFLRVGDAGCGEPAGDLRLDLFADGAERDLAGLKLGAGVAGRAEERHPGLGRHDGVHLAVGQVLVAGDGLPDLVEGGQHGRFGSGRFPEDGGFDAVAAFGFLAEPGDRLGAVLGGFV
jgi:hypothetical protein